MWQGGRGGGGGMTPFSQLSSEGWKGDRRRKNPGGAVLPCPELPGYSPRPTRA